MVEEAIPSWPYQELLITTCLPSQKKINNLLAHKLNISMATHLVMCTFIYQSIRSSTRPSGRPTVSSYDCPFVAPESNMKIIIYKVPMLFLFVGKKQSTKHLCTSLSISFEPNEIQCRNIINSSKTSSLLLINHFKNSLTLSECCRWGE